MKDRVRFAPQIAIYPVEGPDKCRGESQQAPGAGAAPRCAACTPFPFYQKAYSVFPDRRPSPHRPTWARRARRLSVRCEELEPRFQPSAASFFFSTGSPDGQIANLRDHLGPGQANRTSKDDSRADRRGDSAPLAEPSGTSLFDEG